MQGPLSDHLSFATPHPPSLRYSLISFLLWLEYVTFTPTSGPLHCCSLCTAVPSAKGLHSLDTIHIPVAVSPPLADPPCPPVSRTRSPFFTPCFLPSPCLAVLKYCFIWLCFSPFSLISECQVFESKDFVLFTTVSPQRPEQSWCHTLCTRVPAADWTMTALPCSFPPCMLRPSWTDDPIVSMGLNSVSLFLKSTFTSFSIWKWSSTHLICVVLLAFPLLFMNMIYLYRDAGPSWPGWMSILGLHLGLTQSGEIDA